MRERVDHRHRVRMRAIPDAAVVDYSLRAGEFACDLIDRVHLLGVRIVVMTDHDEVPLVTDKAAAILGNSVSEALLIAGLRPAAPPVRRSPLA
jgi:hypothetical protein